MNFEKINVHKILEIAKDIKDVEIFYSSFDITSFIEISNIYNNANRSFLIDSFEEYRLNDLFSIRPFNINVFRILHQII